MKHDDFKTLNEDVKFTTQKFTHNSLNECFLSWCKPIPGADHFIEECYTDLAKVGCTRVVYGVLQS